MTNNEIIEMAIHGHGSTRDAIRWAIEQVREEMRLDGIHTCHNKCQRPVCVAIRKAVAAEREECAKVCESLNEDFDSLHVESCAEAIRARKQ